MTTTSENPYRRIRDAAHALEGRYLEALERLVRSESPSNDPVALDATADVLATILTDAGWQVERVALTDTGDQLVARRSGGDGPRTLLLAHYDTVWPVGTLAAMPFRRDGDVVYGPGVVDMKAGIITGALAPRVLEEAGLGVVGPATLLVTSDEEVGSRRSREIIERLAREHDRVLVLEPGRDDGALKIGRKGVGMFDVRFEGRSAHAGNNPTDGASALRELAHFLLFVEDLQDADAGTTVNLTVASGGSTTNVIAETASAKVDLRALKATEGERVERAVQAYRPRDERVRVVVEGGLNRPPLEPTDANAALFDEARVVLAGMGVALEGAVVGGGSDGNFTSALGIPTLDGLGAAGEGPHARHEQIRVRETLDRLALVAGLLARI